METCAPGRIDEYKDGQSCFTVDELLRMANSYNNTVRAHHVKNYILEPIDIKADKKYLLKQLTDRLRNVCKDQLCWIKQEFVLQLDDTNIIKNTFRPPGPRGPQHKFDWLNTENINQVMTQYEVKYPDFKFFGAVPVDFATVNTKTYPDKYVKLIQDMNYEKLIADGKYRWGHIYNSDSHSGPGRHWFSSISDVSNKTVYFFDSARNSVVEKPDKRIVVFLEKMAGWFDGKIKYNNVVHQYKDTECGVYSINFIVRMLNGEPYDDIIKTPISDDAVNTCRKVYFTPEK
ncbi:MAG: Ulp1 protease [Faunusvirus sp.]|jgi:hypothetical protein|uniref:Ulp1 protease n=1 Tax=Faunusvirus sp. TaxID=2487766 RepID=A0A3G4ZXT0_9VIRU|nr:MAG: Ulp1 protease [Faunusvirus sp.]